MNQSQQQFTLCIRSNSIRDMLDARYVTEYRKSLGKLSFLNTMIIHEKREYIIYFQPMESKGKCKIQVTNGFDFWVEDFDLDKFETKRKTCGLEGTYNSYFDMMNKSILQRNFEVTIGPQQNFVLILFFQLNKGVSLKGDFELGLPLHFDDIKEFHCIYRLFLFDIFKAKDQEKLRAEQARKQTRGGRAQAAIEAGNEDTIEEEEPENKAPNTRRKRNPTAMNDI